MYFAFLIFVILLVLIQITCRTERKFRVFIHATSQQNTPEGGRRLDASNQKFHRKIRGKSSIFGIKRHWNLTGNFYSQKIALSLVYIFILNTYQVIAVSIIKQLVN